MIKIYILMVCCMKMILPAQYDSKQNCEYAKQKWLVETTMDKWAECLPLWIETNTVT